VRIEFDVRVARRAGFLLETAASLEAGSLGIVGPSGSGKSTLLDAIAGIEPGARVVLDGQDCSRDPLHRRAVGYVAQDALLFPHLSVRENLLYSPRAVGLGDIPSALGIESLLDRRPRNLSGGERRRVALGRAILSRPRILLLDEPFGGLDERRRREAMGLLAAIRDRFRLPMILVSHLADEVIGLTDWTLRLESGRIAALGPSAKILRASETRIDNYLTGEVRAPGRVVVDGIELAALLPEGARGTVRLACYAHDLLLSRGVPEGISARNVLSTRIERITAMDDAVLVELAPPRLKAIVTPEAAQALGLRPGADTVCVLKATSIVYLGPA
jgi:molybdate transport system ATP-binding protein